MKKLFAFVAAGWIFALFISPISAQTCMQIGVGLAGPAYWETGENAFIDQLKYRGHWITFNHVGSSPWDTNLDHEIPMDSVGYPNAGIPYNTVTGGLQRTRFVVSASNRVPENVQYVFLYDGYGEFDFHGFTVDSVAPNRIVVTVTGTGNVWIDLDSSSVAPNHARNFRLVPLAEELTYEQDIFRANWLNRARDFYSIRFMDWFHTNNNPVQNWSMRSTPNSYSQADSAGICYEYAIEAANRTGAHPWVCIPALVDSQYIVNMARMWHNRLDPELDIYVEYSNEVWNFQFQQTQWIQQNTGNYPSHWPLNSKYNSSLNWAENEGLMQGWAINIFRQEWGADSNRVHRVVATQAVNSWVSINVLEGAERKFDYLSPAWYFGTSTSQSAAFGAGTTPEQVIDTCRANFFVRSVQDQKEHYIVADTMGGKGVIHYEGGQHISAYGNSSHPALQAFYDAQVHPNMYQLYDDVLDSLREWGSELTMAFVLGGGNGRYGSWGHITSVDSTPSMSYSPKYMALLDNMLMMPQPALGADTVLCTGETLLLDPGNFAGYAWSNGDSATSIQVSTAGTYSVEVTDVNGCVGTDSIWVDVQPCTGLEAGVAPWVRVWPNPTSGEIFIHSEERQNASITLSTLEGRVLDVVGWNGTQAHLDMTNYPAGLYLLSVESKNERQQFRIVRH